MSGPDDPKPYTPTEIDDTEDRMGSVHELDFSDRNDDRVGRVGDERPAQEVDQEFPQAGCRKWHERREALSDSLHEDNVTYDDLSPDTLLDETGARDPMYRVTAAGPRTKPCVTWMPRRSAVASASMKRSWRAPRRWTASRGPTTS